ncbi:hypothetical protein SDC9_64507 [bioreactor metagenome]|uniref:Uncharacterized protein n=1 Tax=bioreactor metagenome TaxID=1076179 RepID=A0A644XQP6_9ZZZZ
MAMTAADRLELQGKFVSLDDYEKDKTVTNNRLDCVEKSQAKNDLVVVRIDTQLKIIMWICSVSGAALIGILVKQLWG